MKLQEGKEVVYKASRTKCVIETVANSKVRVRKKGSNLTFEVPRKDFNSIFS